MKSRAVLLSLALTLAASSMLLGDPVASAKAVPTPKTATVAYGDGPVRQDSWDQPVHLTFEAKKGDLVGLDSSAAVSCETVALAGPEGTVLQTATRLHVIPETGTYTFAYEQVCSYPEGSDAHGISNVQLLKARVVPVRLGQGKVRLAADRGYVDLAEIVVRRKDGPVVLDANGGADHRRGWTRVFRAGSLRSLHNDGVPFTPWYGTPALGDPETWGAPAMVLEAGTEVAGAGLVGPIRGGVAHYFYDHERARTVRLVPLRTERLRLDGAGAKVRLGRTRAFRFRGEADQWIRVDGGELPHALELRDRDGTIVSMALRSQPATGPVAVWRLPATGRYRLDVRHAASDHRRASYPIRIRSVVESRRKLVLEETLTSRMKPGRWVTYRVERKSSMDLQDKALVVLDASTQSGWTAALIGHLSSAGTSFGCVSTVERATEDVTGADWAIVIPGNRAGSLDLTLAPQAAAAYPREECPMWSDW